MELAQTVPWGRSFDEYVRMFALSARDLALPIVGCGDGPASFNAEMTQRGHQVISVDPLYRFSAAQIAFRVREIADEMVEGARRKSDAFVWTDFRSPEELGRRRLEIVERFLADYESGRRDGRYVQAALPELPFRNGQFELALCSHLLFTYSKLLSEDDHVCAILEMCRVAAEARIFPVLDMFDGGRSPHLDAVIDRARRAGFAAELIRVPYEFQRGGNEMLKVTRAEL
ncbi:MAG TPA: class I SAM-dependent methyltransferase [Planctomycetaceae bacterium]|nr:class I SAM-dependent methyltransferase [Planctomycetaceae bacterium]